MHTARIALTAALVAVTLPAAGVAASPAAPRNTSLADFFHLRAGVSGNWAGPVRTGGSYEEVRTSFVVPQVSCPAGGGFMLASLWAGIDGAAASSDTVEQAGINVECDDGTAAYQAWTEEYPAPSAPLPERDFSPAPGDDITVTVSVRDHIDTYTFADHTTGRHYTTSAPAPRGADAFSAECIAEAPTGRHGLEKLPDFGTATFSGCRATVAGSAGACRVVTGEGCPSGSHLTLDNIVGFRYRFIPVIKATTVAAGSGGFTVTWHHD